MHGYNMAGVLLGATVAMLVSQGARVNLYAQPKPPSAVRVPTDQILDPTHRALLGGVELEPELAVCNTPAHAATVQGHFRVVLFLVQQGADVSQPCSDGSTVSEYAHRKV